MLNRKDQEPNFIERKREWRGGIDSGLNKRTIILILPAIILGVFVLMAAPYVDDIYKTFVKKGDKVHLSEMNTEEEKEAVEKPGPPPNPEQVVAEFHRKRLEEEGFDWRAEPKLEEPVFIPEETALPARELKRLAVEVPSTYAELVDRQKAEQP